jgi:hypothetical protein
LRLWWGIDRWLKLKSICRDSDSDCVVLRFRERSCDGERCKEGGVSRGGDEWRPKLRRELPIVGPVLEEELGGLDERHYQNEVSLGAPTALNRSEN